MENPLDIKPVPQLRWNYVDENGNINGKIGSSIDGDPSSEPVQSAAPPTGNGWFVPSNMYDYYGFNSISNQISGLLSCGAGQTIAIIDLYGSPYVQSDLNTFCAAVGIPSTNVEIHYPYGTPTLYNWDWARETALDVQYAHAMAISAKIVLVIDPQGSFVPQCVAYAVSALSANIVSMSLAFQNFDPVVGTYPFSLIENFSAQYVAAAGDWGPEINWPASSPYVLSVGGTTLTGGTTSHYFGMPGVYSEVVWNWNDNQYATSGGISIVNPRPSYQDGWHTATGRGIPDVSYNAGAGVAVYVTDPTGARFPGWYSLGGTSAGTPQWAGILARMNSAGLNITNKNSINTTLYSLASSNYANYFIDITIGNDNINNNKQYYSANSKYDFVTGLGSPRANNLILLGYTNTPPVTSYTPPVTSYNISSSGLDVMIINNFSNIYWYPVDFNITGEQLNLSKTPITFSNGMSFNIFDGLQNLQDISFNNQSGIFLTGLNKNSNILTDNIEPENTNELSSIESSLADTNGNVFNIINNSLINSNSTKINNDNKLKFNFYKNQIYIQNGQNSLLTSTDNGLVFAPQKVSLNTDSNQLFDYLINNQYISLFKSNTDFTTAVSSINGVLTLSNINPNLPLPSNVIFYLPSYQDKTRSYNSVADSFLVTYQTIPLNVQNELQVATKNTDYSQNYLGVFPTENFNITSSGAVADLYFHSLKNYQTTEYNYNNNSNNRVYTKIYSGTNQDKGLNSIHLGYQSDTIRIELPVGDTYFFYSPTSNIVYIKDAGFIQSGAVGGEMPEVSDRIYTNAYSYSQDTSGLNIFSSNIINNKWLCSWLRKNTDNTLTWCDRYYNSAYYTSNQALSTASLVYNDKLNPNLPYVYDIESQTQLKPGIRYQYHHVGKTDNQNFLTYLNYNYVNKTPANILTVTNWLSSTLVDDSSLNNKGLVYSNSYTNYDKDYFKLTGDNYVVFPATDSLLPSEKLSVSLWVKADDWSNISGYQIFGNYYYSGFGLINESNIQAPILTLINNDTNKVYNLNYRFSEVSKNTISTVFPKTSFSIVQRLPDYSYWVFDTVNFRAIKYDPDNNIVIDKIIANNAYLTRIDQIEMNGVGSFYVYDNDKKKYLILDAECNFKAVKSVSASTNRIEIDLNNRLKEIYGNASVIDNSNNIWEVIGINLYKNRNIFAVVGASKQITCDKSNNIWILSNDDQYTKIDSDGNFVFSYNFSQANLDMDNCPIPQPIKTPVIENVLSEDYPFQAATGDKVKYTLAQENLIKITTLDYHTIYPTQNKIRKRYINFINSPLLTNTCSLSSFHNDLLVMVDSTDKEVYLLNQEGSLVSKLNMNGLVDSQDPINFIAEGDFTGYQNLRKYHLKTHNLCWKFKVADKNNKYAKLVSLNFDPSSLTPGWHHFSLVFDSTQGIAQYMVDAVQVSQTTSIPNVQQLYYDYRTSLLLGAASVKNTILNNYLNSIQGYRFVGSVANLRMYNIYLTPIEMQHVYLSSELSPEFKSIKWDMQVGTRNYVEEIKHWFNFQLQGNKSKYYNINIHNLNVSDKVKANIQNAIKGILNKVSPVHTSLYKINWK